MANNGFCYLLNYFQELSHQVSLFIVTQWVTRQDTYITQVTPSKPNRIGPFPMRAYHLSTKFIAYELNPSKKRFTEARNDLIHWKIL